MSTPLERIEQYARQLAIDTALLVNKLDAAALVAAVMGDKCDEERFLAVCKSAYQSATSRLKGSTADYLGKMVPPAPPAPCADCGGPGFLNDGETCTSCAGTGRSTPSSNPTGGPPVSLPGRAGKP